MNMPSHCVYLVRYALYSGVAVLCELAVFAVFFRHYAFPPFWANTLSAVAGLALAWCISGRRLFGQKKITFAGHIIWYSYQCVVIGIYSYIVSWLIQMDIHYLLSKSIVLALSFAINSLFFKKVILKERSIPITHLFVPLALAGIHCLVVIPIFAEFMICKFEDFPLIFIIQPCIIIIFWQIIALFICRYRNEKEFRLYIHCTIPYLLFSIIMLAILWPGLWRWDDIFVLHDLKQMHIIESTVSWQHVFTGIFYYIGIVLFPTAGSIVMLQICCISLIVGYVIYALFKIVDGSYIAVFGYIPFVLPYTLLMNYYPIRAVLYGYLTILFFSRLYMCYRYNTILNLKDIVFFSLFSSLLITLRGEGMVYIIFAPLVFYAACYKICSKRMLAIFITIMILCSCTIHFIQFRTMGNAMAYRYALTTFINPLHAFVMQARNEGREEFIKPIQNILNIDVLLQHDTGEAAYWSGNVIFDNEFLQKDNQQKLRQHFIVLMLQYPSVFFQERWNTFLKTQFSSSSVIPDNLYKKYFSSDRYSQYTFIELHKYFADRLLSACYPAHDYQKLIFSCIAVLMIAATIAAYRREYYIALGAFCIISVSIVIFLASAGRYHMYYFSTCITSCWSLCTFIIYYIHKFQKKRQQIH